MDYLKDMDAQTLVMTMMWIMMTGAGIWVIDNLMKNLENPMEDGFKKQARLINRSIRVNLAILLLCFSAYGYVRYYLKKDINNLPEIFQGFVWVASSVAKFFLHLLAYVVYYGDAYFGDNSYPKPEADQDIIVGFGVIVGYILVRRVLVQRMSPAVWALLVVLLMVFGTYMTNGSEFGDRIQNFLKERQKENTTIVDDNPTVNNNDTNEYNPEDKHNINVLNQELDSIIKLYVYDLKRTTPHHENYDNEETFNLALRQHTKDMMRHPLHEAISEKTAILQDFEYTEYEKSVIQETVEKELCPYAADFFYKDHLCDSPFAN